MESNGPRCLRLADPRLRKAFLIGCVFDTLSLFDLFVGFMFWWFVLVFGSLIQQVGLHI